MRGDRDAFSSFFERNALREKRARERRRTIVTSVVIHVVALSALVLYSFWDVDELWSPHVKVKVFSPNAAPAAASR